MTEITPFPSKRTQTGKSSKRLIVVVRGVGDVGAAVICKLAHQGHFVIGHEDRQTRSIRRKMSFCDVPKGHVVTLDGVTAFPLENDALWDQNKSDVPVSLGDFDQLIENIQPDIIIDSRIHKTVEPEVILGKSALSIGVGPMFKVGKHCDVIVESCWGPTLGQVISEGHAISPMSEPPHLNGIGWERFIRSPMDGIFNSSLEIGDLVEKNQLIGLINNQEIFAPIKGHLRGLLQSGLNVLKGEKLAEIDPRGDKAHFEGLAERPSQIADGVSEAVQDFLQKTNPVSLQETLRFQGAINNNGMAVKMSCY